MNTMSEDYWPPVQGSWEESVEPYQAQLVRLATRQPEQEEREITFEMLVARQSGDYRAGSMIN